MGFCFITGREAIITEVASARDRIINIRMDLSIFQMRPFLSKSSNNTMLT